MVNYNLSLAVTNINMLRPGYSYVKPETKESIGSFANIFLLQHILIYC